jgi:hypothetical protein
MTKLYYRIISSILFLVILNISVNGQFNYKINAESGLFRSFRSGLYANNNEDILLAAEGLAGYKINEDRRNALVQIRLRPEFYGISNELRSLKFKASAAYYEQENNFNWGINTDRLLFNFNGNNIDISYNQFLISGELTFFPFDNGPLVADAGYSFEKITSDQNQNLDMTFINACAYNIISTSLKVGYGIYLERFFVTSNINQPQNKNGTNNGWRYGPQLKINYLKDFITSLDYEFLLHNSRLTSSLSYENMLRFVAGKIISERWSAFVLVDYYSRNFKIKDAANNYDALLYTAANYENRIYLKLAYDVTDALAVYFKSGYFKENISNDKFTFEGINILLGLELGN